MKTINVVRMLHRLVIVSVLSVLSLSNVVAAEQPDKVYELRTYHTYPGKLPALQTRFREHTDAIFKRLGMKVINYWVPTNEPQASNTLIYIIEHDSEADAKQKWQTFVNDPEWITAYQASRKDGPLVEKVDVVFMRKVDLFAP